MFGRKGLGGAPPPRGPGDGFDEATAPGGKVDLAMQAAIRLFTEVLRAAGRDPEALGLAGPPPADVARLVAECVTYTGENGPQYMTLGLTRDFHAFSYQPHCFLFLIANAAGIAESLPDIEARARIAAAECRVPLFHAQALRKWIAHVRPIGRALAERDFDGITRIMAMFESDLARLCDDAPEWLRNAIDLPGLAQEWRSGFPATIGRPLDAEVQRINGIPMSDFVAETITRFLAETQMRGLAGRQAHG